MDREHLHGLGVGLQAAAALLVAGLLLGVGDPLRAARPSARSRPGCSAAAAACSSWPTWRRSVRRRSPSTLRRARRPGRPSTSVIVSTSDATPAHAQHPRPAVQAPVDLLPLVVGGRGDPLGVPAEERGQRRRARARGGAGRSSASSSRSQSRAGVGAEDAARAVDDRRDADRVERVAHERRAAVGAHEHGDVARAAPARAERRPSSARRSISRPEASSATTSAARSRATCRARGVVAARSRCGSCRRSGPRGARRARAAARRPARRQPRRAVGRGGAHACGRRSPRGRAARRRTARRRRRSAPGRCAS